MARGFSAATGFDVGVLYETKTGGNVDFELYDEKVLFFKLLRVDSGLGSTPSSSRHSSSLTGMMWVPIVRRYRRNSVETPKIRR